MDAFNCYKQKMNSVIVMFQLSVGYSLRDIMIMNVIITLRIA